MARNVSGDQSGTPGYISAQAYFDDPNTAIVADSFHAEHDIGKIAFCLEQLDLANPITRRVTEATYVVVDRNVVIFADTDTNAITIDLPVGSTRRHIKITNSGISDRLVMVSPDGLEKLIGFNEDFQLFDGEALDIHWDPVNGWD